MNTATKTIVPIFFLFFTLCAPLFVFAAEIRLDSHKAEVKTGEQFVIDVVVNSKERLNAVEGTLVFSGETLSIEDIRDGNSVINFWIEKPHSASPNTVFFSGITPGGFSGPSNLVFSLLFEARTDGLASVSLADITALRNDGVGTKEPLSIRNVEIVVKPGDSRVRKESLMDIESPEDFTPIISADTNLFEGKYAAFFATQDKGSGIDRYEVKEFRFPILSLFSPWTITESPYVLKDQTLKSHILIKAIDNAENERIATVTPRNSLLWYDYLSIIAILIIALAFCILVLKIVWKRK